MDKMLCFYIDHFQNHTNITLLNIRCVMYLSTLFPTHPNEIHCTILLNTFKHLWNDLQHCENSNN